MATAYVHNLRVRRTIRARARIADNQSIPRLHVNRSLRHISAQVIDDQKGITLAAASDIAMTTGTKTERAAQIGEMVAKAALAAGVTAVRFDRGSAKYHGRVAAVAEAARAAGLTF
jgi:large subunit ribosomal protein L18